MADYIPQAKWTEDRLVDLLNFMLDHHGDFVKAKRNGTTPLFYNRASDAIGLGLPGKKVEDLFKNIGKEFRKIQVVQGQSGIETENVNLKLRDSETVYQLYGEYQSVYFPKGSAIRPQILVTPAGVVSMSRQSASQNSATGATSATTAYDEYEPNPSTSDSDTCADRPTTTGASTRADADLLTPSSIQSSTRPHVARQLFLPPGYPSQLSQSGHKRSAGADSSPSKSTSKKSTQNPKLRREDFLSTSVDYQQQYIEVLRRQNVLMQNLVHEVFLFRTAYQAVNGIDMIDVGEEQLPSSDDQQLL